MKQFFHLNNVICVIYATVFFPWRNGEKSLQEKPIARLQHVVVLYNNDVRSKSWSPWLIAMETVPWAYTNVKTPTRILKFDGGRDNVYTASRMKYPCDRSGMKAQK